MAFEGLNSKNFNTLELGLTRARYRIQVFLCSIVCWSNTLSAKLFESKYRSFLLNVSLFLFLRESFEPKHPIELSEKSYRENFQKGVAEQMRQTQVSVEFIALNFQSW